MGMDVCGKVDAGPGAYFRASIWSWPGVWQAAIDAAPEIAAKVEHPWSNDGDGLGADDARALGDALLRYLGDDEVGRERETVSVYPGGAETQVAEVFASLFGIPTMNEGESAFQTDRDHVRRFAIFLQQCGGFEIW